MAQAAAGAGAIDVEYGPRVHPVLHLLKPVVTAGAVAVARAGIRMCYERVSGRTAPVVTDPATSWRRAIAWTLVTAPAAALIVVTVHRVANKREVSEVLHRARSRGGEIVRRGEKNVASATHSAVRPV